MMNFRHRQLCTCVRQVSLSGVSRESGWRVWLDFLGCGCSFWQMPQGVSLDKTRELFSQVFCMVSAAFKSLRHQQDVKAQRILLAGIVGKVSLKESVADLI